MQDLDRIAEAAQNFKHFFMGSFGAEDARDLVNDLFIIAARTNMRDPAKLLPIMVTVARRLVVKRIRWKHVRRNTAAYQDEAEALPNRTSSPEQELIRREKLDRVQGWMHRLKPADRELIRRFYFDEQSQDQIQREMGLSQKQFELKKNRALGKLAAMAARYKPRNAATW